MLTDFLAAGDNEIINTARLASYMRNVGSPFSTGSAVCNCSSLTPAMLGEADGAYDTPSTDPAPWYDPDLPVSGEFLGMLVLSISGLNNNPRARNVTNAVGGGGVFGPSRELPRTITVSGLLIGTTCCGVDYGMHWLTEALAGCTGDACDGDCLTLYVCCPSAEMTQVEFNAQHRRTFRRAALVDGPTETGRTGTGTCAAGSCGAGGDIVEVEFTLVAASPWPWTDTTPLLDVGLPIGGTGDCVEWCLSSDPCTTEGCAHADCTADPNACADPLNPIPTPPQPTLPEASFCVPLVSERACYDIDLSNRPQWSSDVPMITVTAGSSELRNVRISFYEKRDGTTQTCEEIADANRCAPQNDFVITYVPAGGSVTIDGQIGKATTECNGQCQSASTVFGDQDGGPLRINEFTCAELCVCIESDPTYPPAADAGFSLAVSGRGY